MSDEKALLPVEERTVIFYDDELTAVLVHVGDEEQVFVPVRPLCDYLGVDWSAQRKRIVGDAVLSAAGFAQWVVIRRQRFPRQARNPRAAHPLPEGVLPRAGPGVRQGIGAG